MHQKSKRMRKDTEVSNVSEQYTQSYIYLEEGDSVEILRCFSSDTKIEIREKFKENP
ncbi:hypothetical protein RUMHYD_03571 [Blautia hydrogenotrophica DSM 10507]|uniref:Uncharacterized protein n=1 Tax=Blautia hydrogenotrophica (strain DSM 10507 / JCM 14656 / S5a33) TaxID=476272 RepID=C0CRQ7_BLAHS|nr:hypothetical protein RUMHYD_03571 [Blautia hydrogenotrophica DSM 10507]